MLKPSGDIKLVEQELENKLVPYMMPNEVKIDFLKQFPDLYFNLK